MNKAVTTLEDLPLNLVRCVAMAFAITIPWKEGRGIPQIGERGGGSGHKAEDDYFPSFESREEEEERKDFLLFQLGRNYLAHSLTHQFLFLMLSACGERMYSSTICFQRLLQAEKGEVSLKNKFVVQFHPSID